ncbi:MAG: electron transfer flavoprotein subunit beta/FixA family protein [Spirochaetes bacterium]|nr:electron transfer flavoprotein subunit beta/FixA family protein [Spirochaetota bacterium]
MKILVCIDRVCDGEAPFTVEGDGRTIRPADQAAWRMNRYDEFAMEEALQLKERGIAAGIDAVSVGTDATTVALRKALEMGAHDAVLIRTGEVHLTPAMKAHLIAAMAADVRYDLILAGMTSEQGLNAAVGPMIAALLKIPHATAVLKMDLEDDCRRVRVQRELDAETRECFRLSLPAVVAVQSGINRPRYPSLSNVLRARDQEIRIINASDLAGAAPDQEIVAVRKPRAGTGFMEIQGSTVEKAEGLYAWLHERSLL